MNTETTHQTEDHGHHDSVNIIVNGRPHRVHGREISFERVVALAFEAPPSGSNVVFTVTYRNGPPENPAGTMVAGQTVRIKNGMIFNVTATDKS